MKIVNTEINIFHRKIDNMRKRVIELEEILSDEFITPLNILPIPDDAPQDIPRIIGQTKNLHTEIQMSQIFTKLIIRYDKEYVEDWSKCHDYILQKLEKIYGILDSIVDSDYDFVGITTRLNVETDNPVELLRSKFISADANSDIEELSARVAFVKEDRYFVNLQIGTNDIDIGDKSINQAKIVKVIGCNIDINDKYSLLHGKGHKSNLVSAKEILKKIDNVVSENIDEILEKGCIGI